MRFRSHIDGALVELTPERAVAIQEQLGSDVAMVLDHVVALPNDRDVVADAMRRSVRWAERCQAAATRADQALFAIVQGGLDAELRAESAERLVALDFRRLRHRRPERRRDAGRNVRRARRRRRRCCRAIGRAT